MVLPEAAPRAAATFGPPALDDETSGVSGTRFKVATRPAAVGVTWLDLFHPGTPSRLTLDARVRVIGDVAGALIQIHDNSGLPRQHRRHGRVTPRHVLVGVDGSASLFHAKEPFSKLLPQQPDLGYLAPELLTQSGIANPLTDVFSLGVLLWEALDNGRLFPHRRAASISRLIARRSLPQPRIEEEWALPLADVALAALSPEPEQRPASATAFWLALRDHMPAPDAARATLGRLVQQALKLELTSVIREAPPYVSGKDTVIRVSAPPERALDPSEFDLSARYSLRPEPSTRIQGAARSPEPDAGGAAALGAATTDPAALEPARGGGRSGAPGGVDPSLYEAQSRRESGRVPAPEAKRSYAPEAKRSYAPEAQRADTPEAPTPRRVEAPGAPTAEPPSPVLARSFSAVSLAPEAMLEERERGDAARSAPQYIEALDADPNTPAISRLQIDLPRHLIGASLPALNTARRTKRPFPWAASGLAAVVFFGVGAAMAFGAVTALRPAVWRQVADAPKASPAPASVSAPARAAPSAPPSASAAPGPEPRPAASAVVAPAPSAPPAASSKVADVEQPSRAVASSVEPNAAPRKPAAETPRRRPPRRLARTAKPKAVAKAAATPPTPAATPATAPAEEAAAAPASTEPLPFVEQPY